MKDMSSRRHGDKNVGVDIQSRVNSGDKHDVSEWPVKERMAS